MKKYPDNKKIERVYMKFSSLFEGLISFYIFRKPIGYITNIYSSNVKSKSFMIGFMVVSFFLGLVGGRQTERRPIYKYFSANKYYTFNNKANVIFPYNYEDLQEGNRLIFTPIIPSEVVSGKYLKLFIPTIEREKEQMHFFERTFWQKLSKVKVNRDSLAQVNLRNISTFNQIFINDKAYTNPDFQFYTYPNSEVNGVQTYIPTDTLLVGKNLLEIRKNYFSEDSTQKIVKIPFYFEGG